MSTWIFGDTRSLLAAPTRLQRIYHGKRGVSHPTHSHYVKLCTDSTQPAYSEFAIGIPVTWAEWRMAPPSRIEGHCSSYWRRRVAKEVRRCYVKLMARQS
jgi:hypothetical protein